MGTNNQVGSVSKSSATQVSRAVEEVRVSILTAKQFPRVIDQVIKDVQQHTSRVGFAKTALYSYPKGGKQVEGPSIRMAEMLATAYGNLNFGIGEIERGDDYSIVQAYAHDLQTNVKKVVQFDVPHYREAHGKSVRLTSSRDIYEMVANLGARRLRACVLAVIPSDIQEEAVESVRKTLETKFDESTFFKAMDTLIKTYYKNDKDKAQKAIEVRFRKNYDVLTINEKITLINIVNSLENGMGKLEDWFADNKIIDQPDDRVVKQEDKTPKFKIPDDEKLV